MKENWKYFMLLVLLGVTASSGFAQPLTINCNGEHIKIPEFIEDSSFSYNNWYTEHNIIYPIKTSKADWEIRLFSEKPLANRGYLYTIRCFGDSVYFTHIVYEQRNAGDSVFREDKVVEIDKYGYAIFRNVTLMKPNEPIVKILQKLIKNHLFTLNDYHKIRKSLVKKKINIVIPETRPLFTFYETFYCVEIKVGTHFRNYKIEPEFGQYNKNIRAFQFGDRIIKILRDNINIYAKSLKSGREY